MVQSHCTARKEETDSKWAVRIHLWLNDWFIDWLIGVIIDFRIYLTNRNKDTSIITSISWVWVSKFVSVFHSIIFDGVWVCVRILVNDSE